MRRGGVQIVRQADMYRVRAFGVYHLFVRNIRFAAVFFRGGFRPSGAYVATGDKLRKRRTRDAVEVHYGNSAAADNGDFKLFFCAAAGGVFVFHGYIILRKKCRRNPESCKNTVISYHISQARGRKFFR